MICNHTFIRINDTEKPRPNQGTSWSGMIAGATVGCIHCAQIRKVFEDGSLEITVEGGAPINEDAHDSTSDT